ncbi:thiamine-phosphate kinase [Synechococcus sp. AH-551-G15]|nr:thiamine-phosphate kinase [Synechococcus sp. AH-551-G15]
MSITLAELGETELLDRLARFAPPGQLDDDTAMLPPDSRALLVNTDVMVEGVHFSDATTAPADVGWRAVVANLSDLAASGSEQVEGITVSLVAPGTTSWWWVEQVYQGISEALEHFGGTLLGGDCSTGNQRLLSISAFGRLGPLRLHRAQAQPGDLLMSSGPHGLSRLGLALLQDTPLPTALLVPPTLKEQAIRCHQRPWPRFDALKTLMACKPKQLPWRAAGTDSSDGLLAAVNGLCRSSGCGAVLRRDALPRADAWPCEGAWDHWCLSGGEDFELVLSLPPEWAESWRQHQPGSCCFGAITADKGRIIWNDNGALLPQSGFSHYR